MTSFSRREFLRRSGAALIGTTGLDGLQPNSAQPTAAIPDLVRLPTHGRPFQRTPVYQAMDEASPIIRYLTQDSQYAIGLAGEGWYQAEGGFVAREAIQSIHPYARPPLMGEGEFWAEMIAPVSAIRQWCGANAPIVAQPGFGAVVYVMDRITDDRGRLWYGLADQPGTQLIGWSGALHYAAWMPALSTGTMDQPAIAFEMGRQRCVVYDRELPIGQAPIRGRLPREMLHDNFEDTQLHAIQPGGQRPGPAPLGSPWIMELTIGDRRYPVYGAYWHNQFGKTSPDVVNNESIELQTFVARWLYSLLLGNGTPVSVTMMP